MSEEQTVETPVEATDTVEQNVDILTSEGKFNEAWRDALPDDLGKHSIWSKYDNPTDLVKGAINAQSQIGKKAEDFWLSEDANDIARRREIMNIPNEVSGYEFKTENIPEDTELDTAKVDSFKELAHKVGLTQEQAQAVVDWEVQGSAESLQELDTQAEVAVKQAEEDLRREWTGDKYEYNMGKVANVMDYLGLGEFKDDPDIGNNVPFIKAIFENVVPLISDDEIIQDGMEQNYATVSDQLSVLEEQMRDYAGLTSDVTYRNMLKERLALLEKLS
mgnify:CR=1 FL=1